MRTLIVGGNGFIGSHVQDVLLQRGHEVRVLDVRMESYRVPLPGVEQICGSSESSSNREQALAGVDAVLYLASTSVPSTSNTNVPLDIESNLVPLAAMLDDMLKAGVRRIVYFSSGGTVYGPTGMQRVREDAPLDPICSYGIVKVAAEKYLGMYRYLHGISPMVLRPSNPFGPRQSHQGIQGFVGTALSRMARGEHLEIWGDGGVVRDYLYVEDLALAAALALESDKMSTLNIGSGLGHSLNEMLQLITDATGIVPDVRYMPSRGFDVPRLVLDIGQAHDSLGWRPATLLTDGLQLQWDWLMRCDERHEE